MHCRSTRSQPLRLAGALLARGPVRLRFANATPKPLADAEIARRARRRRLHRWPASRSRHPARRTACQRRPRGRVREQHRFSTLLTPDPVRRGARQAPACRWTMMPDYHGEPVAQTVVDAKPVTRSRFTHVGRVARDDGPAIQQRQRLVRHLHDDQLRRPRHDALDLATPLTAHPSSCAQSQDPRVVARVDPATARRMTLTSPGGDASRAIDAGARARRACRSSSWRCPRAPAATGRHAGQRRG
jgi:hypothetical protein